MQQLEQQVVTPQMRQRILERLQQIEQSRQVRILYACESGSRAWGFASPDSDYDVRFIYVHPPVWYLRVEAQRDVIEEPIDDELDLHGWELRKALKLLQGANPTLLEWLNSPVVYRVAEAPLLWLQSKLPDYFSALRGRYHYLSMARNNFPVYRQGEQLRLKKSLYILRALLAIRWIENTHRQPPVCFATLLAGTVQDTQLLLEISRLLAVKRHSHEAQCVTGYSLIQAFIEDELAAQQTASFLPGQAEGKSATLDAILYRAVMGDNHDTTRAAADFC